MLKSKERRKVFLTIFRVVTIYTLDHIQYDCGPNVARYVIFLCGPPELIMCTVVLKLTSTLKSPDLLFLDG